MGSLCPSKSTNGADDLTADAQNREELKKRIKDLINEFHKCFLENVVSFVLIEDLG
jgi:hypothetical protein